jgi:hypothetical protein
MAWFYPRNIVTINFLRVCHTGSSTGVGGGGGGTFHVLAHNFFWILGLDLSYNYFLETCS